MINLVVALASEARPLVRHFRLSQDRASRAFRLYSDEGIRLVVTGVGKLNAASGVGYLGGRSRARDQVWLNVGIGGHRELELSSGVVASKITDHAARRSWYPPLVAGLPAHATQVTTFDAPVEPYPADTVCDMEASAFFACATRFSTAELVQCYKVVSDNGSTGTASVTAPLAEELIAARLPEIESLCRALEALAEETAAGGEVERHQRDYLAKWHFTVAQQARLREALRRLHARGADSGLASDHWRHCRNAREVLQALSAHLDSLPVRL